MDKMETLVFLAVMFSPVALYLGRVRYAAHLSIRARQQREMRLHSITVEECDSGGYQVVE